MTNNKLAETNSSNLLQVGESTGGRHGGGLEIQADPESVSGKENTAWNCAAEDCLSLRPGIWDVAGP